MASLPSPSSMQLLVQRLSLTDWAPDDENGALIFPLEPYIAAAPHRDEVHHAYPRTLSLIDEFQPVDTTTDDTTMDNEEVPVGPLPRKAKPKRAPRVRKSVKFETPSMLPRTALAGCVGSKPKALPKGIALNHRTRKSKERLRQFKAARDAANRKFDADSTIHQRAEKMRGYAGPLYGGDAPPDGLVEIDMGDGASVSVYDCDGVKTVHRAAVSRNPAINAACVAMGSMVLDIQATFDNNQDRGEFWTYYFSLHRGSEPRMSKDVKENIGLYTDLRRVSEPVRAHVEGIFKAEFPLIHKRYADAADTIHEKYPHLQAAFYPFASFCININAKGVVTRRHIDVQNLGPGLCVVIPFGDFDPTVDCKLHIVELGYTFQVAAGTPIFFPSALYTHYNSRLVSMGMRGSIVAWTGASIFQYVDLGCRAVQDLSPEEYKMYKASLKAHVLAGFELFPRK
ncbi:hypothetical protein C8R44DRAFT_872931 [Mycena epipterygia]|nr:hypothetical protein C8R44DRAFT_872931 [Mycena epipterygia]